MHLETSLLIINAVNDVLSSNLKFSNQSILYPIKKNNRLVQYVDVDVCCRCGEGGRGKLVYQSIGDQVLSETRTNQNLDPTFLFDFTAHRWYILHRLGSVHLCPRRTDKLRVRFSIAHQR